MKKIFLIVSACLYLANAVAQPKVEGKDLDNLIALGELYSHNNMCRGDEFIKSANALRTPMLNHIADALIENGKADTTLLSKAFMTRPANDELVLWYALREIHYNRIDTTKKPLPDLDVVQNVLKQQTDERLLVDNYYYLMSDGVATLFNTADLSHHNFNLDSLGFKNETEKAIYFFRMMDQLANGRFRVLHYMKNQDRLLEFARKLPLFNGKPYYYYIQLNIPDFEGGDNYKKDETYLSRQINNLMNTLLIHFQYVAQSGDKALAREIYFNSIMSRPEFFKYCSEKETLQTIYDKSHK